MNAPAPPMLGRPLDYDELIAIVNARVIALNVPHESLESAIGLTRGHLGKLLGPGQVKRMGFDVMWRVFEGLGLQMAVVEHLDIASTIDEMGHKHRTRQNTGARGRLKKKLSPQLARVAAQQYGAMGRGKRKVFRISPAQVRKQRRMAAKARWSKPQVIELSGAEAAAVRVPNAP